MNYIRATGLPLALLLIAAMSGCASRGAASFILFGAFFPAWMLFAGLGIAAALATRVAFVVSGVSALIPLQLWVCVSSGLIVAVVIWLFWFEL